ncbi:6-phosphogluconolactonase [Enhygromyxa salina]|uniref:6-phosphogluconolactonase n=2 Tax=Enhygromyxa salina TaxID=215803 RepID=A0A0C2CWJ0_9BACT|nr:6-phosphogluconolactonase [Enhygromyxa salina]
MRDAIEAAVATRGTAFVALSGGNTPWPAYEALSHNELAWDRVVIIPTDDRLVPFGDPLSNVTATTKIFEPLGARVQPLTDATGSGPIADQRLRSLPWPLDFVLLGVGGDGHTASIFPGKDFAAAVDPHNPARALGVTPDPLPPEAPVARVSLTLAAIAAARAVAVAATGSNKRTVIERAIEEGSNSGFPVGRVLAAIPTPVRVYWAPQ